jgi:hypothetical protein
MLFRCCSDKLKVKENSCVEILSSDHSSVLLNSHKKEKEENKEEVKDNDRGDMPSTVNVRERELLKKS